MGTYESILAGTEVQEVKARLRTVQETYERQIAEIIGAEATGQGFNAPGFEEFKLEIDGMHHNMHAISEHAAQRIAYKVQADIDRTA